MERINLSRVILGGLVAGIVGNVLGYLVDGVILAPQWAEGMKALGKGEFSVNQMLAFIALGLVSGVITVWLYAAIRPRYGAGPRTAALAGLAVWVIGALLPNASLMWITGLFPANLTAMTTAAGIAESVLAALAGAAVYKEGTESLKSMRAGA